MAWMIVSDSSCEIRELENPAPGVQFALVPFKIRVGEREYVDLATLNTQQMLQAMTDYNGASTTACPSPEEWAEYFLQADNVFALTISSNRSGSYNAAMAAREMVLEEHPEKKICVIDSKSTAGAMVLLIRKAKALMEAAAGPEDFESICDQLRLYQAALRTCFTLENFDNLIKNGRMRPLVGTLLHSLGIHVIADATPQGTIHVADKARGEAKTYKAITALMRQSKDCTGAEVVISHCENLSGALKLKQQILEDLPVHSVDILPCRGLTSFYAMEKGLILGY